MQKELDEMLFADEEEDLWEICMFITFRLVHNAQYNSRERYFN
jgi:hypothetical protein